MITSLNSRIIHLSGDRYGRNALYVVAVTMCILTCDCTSPDRTDLTKREPGKGTLSVYTTTRPLIWAHRFRGSSDLVEGPLLAIWPNGHVVMASDARADTWRTADIPNSKMPDIRNRISDILNDPADCDVPIDLGSIYVSVLMEDQYSTITFKPSDFPSTNLDRLMRILEGELDGWILANRPWRVPPDNWE